MLPDARNERKGKGRGKKGSADVDDALEEVLGVFCSKPIPDVLFGALEPPPTYPTDMPSAYTADRA